MKYAIALLAFLAACSSATAPNQNPCSQAMASDESAFGKPPIVTQLSVSSIEWGYPHGETIPGSRSNGAFTVTFDWSSGTCVQTFGT